MKPKCIYCGKEANSKDHIPPKCFLDKPYPSNLDTLPACSKCNSGFSLDEEYFLTVLTQIATVPSLTNKIRQGGSVDRSLTRSSAFKKRIADSHLVVEDGRTMFASEYSRIVRIIQKIAYGLFILRYGKIPSIENIWPVNAYPYNIEDKRPVTTFIATFTESFRPKRWTRTQAGVFSYTVIKDQLMNNQLCCIMDFHHTLWGVAYFPHPPATKRRRDKSSMPLFAEL